MLMAMKYKLDYGNKWNNMHEPRDDKDLKQEKEALMTRKILRNEEHGC